MDIITVVLKAIGVLFCCFLVFAAGIAIWGYILKLGNRKLKREYEYLNLYATIQDCILDWQVTLINHDTLLIMLNELKELKYKNPEKTKVLRDNFNWKYRTIAKQRAKGTCKQYLKVEL